MAAGAFSVQFGAAVAIRLFHQVGHRERGPLRLFIAALLLAAVARPRLRSISGADLRVAMAFGLVLAAMNLSFYEAIARIPLDMSEAMRSPLYRNLFKVMDRDGDGKLFEKEVLAYLDAYQELQAAARLSCATVGITSEGKGLFEMLDTDGDGRLSVREMRNAVKLLAELDRDGDGMISRAEIPRVSQATFRMGPAGAEQFVSTRTGRIRGRTNQPAKPPRGPDWFRKMDRNGDGDVSRREFLGTDAQFREIDSDGDGLISVEEAEAYDKKRREQK